MERIRIKNIFSDLEAGSTATVCGWIRTKRMSKGIAFLALSDGSAQETLQLVIPEESVAFEKLAHCNTGAAIKAVGVIKSSPGKGQQLSGPQPFMPQFQSAILFKPRSSFSGDWVRAP